MRFGLALGENQPAGPVAVASGAGDDAEGRGVATI
jgi:hypothetical protein